MTLIATMLAGPCAVAPTRAAASVLDWVDPLLVLDSGLSAEHLAAVQAQAGEKFRHAPSPGRTTSPPPETSPWIMQPNSVPAGR